MKKHTTRRDQCYAAGSRAFQLSAKQSAQAWAELALSLIAMGERDLPKYRDLIQAVREATITAKK